MPFNLKVGIYNKEGKFYLQYQPILDLESEEVIGAESLLEWKCLSLGEVSSSEFIPVVEEENYIGDLGFFVFEQSCRFLKRVKKLVPSFKININISPIQLLKI
ncbi:MAG TPA: hypothetical protein DEA47_01170 [Peptococcaceae bacterium]|nr:MAG: Sensory box protein [Clostridia bacterium 41_269]HBT19972.1 hypothetical protein [Peptococcaceae bacterium]